MTSQLAGVRTAVEAHLGGLPRGDEPVRLGVPEAAKPVTIAALAALHERPTLVVVASPGRASLLAEELALYAGDLPIARLPAGERLPYELAADDPPPSPNAIGRCACCGRESARSLWCRGRRWRSSGPDRRWRERGRRCRWGPRSPLKRSSARWRRRATGSRRWRTSRAWRPAEAASSTCFRRGRKNQSGSSSSGTRWRASAASTWRRSAASRGCSRRCCRRLRVTPPPRRSGRGHCATPST